jgi:putative transposase
LLAASDKLGPVEAIEQTEGAKFWLRVMNELRDCGVADILIAVVDGLKGFPEAIAAVFPKIQVQACVVHLIRTSLDFISWKDRKAAAAGQEALEAFDEGPWWPVTALKDPAIRWPERRS